MDLCVLQASNVRTLLQLKDADIEMYVFPSLFSVSFSVSC